MLSMFLLSGVLVAVLVSSFSFYRKSAKACDSEAKAPVTFCLFLKDRCQLSGCQLPAILEYYSENVLSKKMLEFQLRVPN